MTVMSFSMGVAFASMPCATTEQHKSRSVIGPQADFDKANENQIHPKQNFTNRDGDIPVALALKGSRFLLYYLLHRFFHRFHGRCNPRGNQHRFRLRRQPSCFHLLPAQLQQPWARKDNTRAHQGAGSRS